MIKKLLTLASAICLTFTPAFADDQKSEKRLLMEASRSLSEEGALILAEFATTHPDDKDAGIILQTSKHVASLAILADLMVVREGGEPLFQCTHEAITKGGSFELPNGELIHVEVDNND